VEVGVEAAEDFVFWFVETLGVEQVVDDVFIAFFGVAFELVAVDTEPGAPQQVCHQCEIGGRCCRHAVPFAKFAIVRLDGAMLFDFPRVLSNKR